MSINFEIICRLCMKHCNSMISLFDDNSILPQKIMTLIPTLKIYAGDNFPTHVCQECADQINKFDNFKLKCESCNLTLNEYLQKQQSENETGENCEKKEIFSDIMTPDVLSQDQTNERENFKNNCENGEMNMCPEVKKEDDAEEYKYDITISEPEIELKIADDTRISDHARFDKTVSSSNEMSESSKPFSVPCQVCGKMVEQRRLKNHVRRHTVGRPCKCEHCGKMFIDQSSLKTHSVVHSGLKVHMCDICGKRFKLLTHLKNHHLTHTGQKSYVCGVCGKKFSQIGNLKRHEFTHTGEKPFSCDMCGKSFSEKISLQIHIAVHAGQRKHICKICGKGFLMTGNLTDHLAVHSGEKRFSCDICGNRYAQRHSLKKHKLKHSIH